jgi:hypothetical protein
MLRHTVSDMVNKVSDPRASIRLTPEDRKLLKAISVKLAPKWEPRKPSVTDIFRVAIRELASKEGVNA